LSIEKIDLINLDIDNLIMKSLSEEKVAVHFCSPFVQNLFQSLVITRESSYRIISAQDITDQWIEENSSQIDLFSSDKAFIITEAGRLSKNQISKIEQDFSSRLIFCDEKKLDKLFAVFGGIKVVAPAFWQFRELSLYFKKFFKLQLDSRKLSIIDESLEKTVDVYWTFFEQLSLFTSDEIEEGFSELIESYVMLDNFKLAGLLNRKSLKQLFDELLNFKDLRSLEVACSFLSGHLIKVIDPSFLDKKSKLNKYEKEIVSARKRYDDKQLVGLLSLLKKISFLSRSQKKEAFIEVMKASQKFTNKI
jgi:hypothetical protein